MTAGTVIVVLGLATLLSHFLTDYWWYQSVGYTGVFTKLLMARIGLFVAGFLVAGGLTWTSLAIAHRLRPLFIPTTPSEIALAQYRRAVEPLRPWATAVVPAVLGLLGGVSAAGQWRSFLLWLGGSRWGVTDSHFHKDVGLFVFSLPFVRFAISYLTTSLVLALILGVVAHYFNGGLQLPGRGPTTRAAFVHVGLLGAAIALLRGVAYWLDRYAQTTADSRLITGVTWTGAHAVIPTKSILAVSAVVCAALFVAAMWTRTWRLPIVGVVVLIATSVIVGSIFPALVQSLRVRPSEQSLEQPYIRANIASTLSAYGLSGIETTDYTPRTDVSAGQLRTDADSIPGIRIMDPSIMSPTFNQLQGLGKYYAFPDTLDVDRYTKNGRVQDVVVGAREINLDGVNSQQRNWVNDHTVYTHGFGVVAAAGNDRTSEGDPVFLAGGLRGGPLLNNFEPRIYFGELSPDYSIVGGGSGQREYDYPDDAAAGGQRTTTYAGKGGVRLNSWWRRLVYAIAYREPKFILSDAATGHARLLDHRTPKERVQRVAPWLTLDGNTYPSVVGGRIVWVVDGYTTTAQYPGSRLLDLGDATEDSITSGSSTMTNIGAGQRINYIRNAVKATVDAYDGTVTLYAWDQSDPLLKAWSRIFSGSVKPLSQISGGLMSHLRYPQDLFKVQRQMLTRYHITDPNSFYSGRDVWRIPADPTLKATGIPPYYQSLTMPGQPASAFSVTTTFSPVGSGREVLRAMLAADSDAGSTTGRVNPDYGKLRLLEMPGDSSIDGPAQVENRIDTSNARSQNAGEALSLGQFITNGRQNGKILTKGNLLTLPVGGGLLYVQPIYIQASRDSGSYPQEKATVAVFGSNVAWGETTAQALDGLFGGNAGIGTGGTGAGGTSTGTTTKTPRTSASLTQQLADAIAAINAANAAGQDALKKGDFAGYGEAQKRLDKAVATATSLAARLGKATPAGK